MKFNDLLFPAAVTGLFVLLSVLLGGKPQPHDEAKPADKTPVADVRKE